MATATRKKSQDDRLEKYESLFEELVRFTKFISDQDEPIRLARVAVEEAKTRLEDAKVRLRELEEIRDGAKHNLYRFLSPSDGQFLPLFDRMEEADEAIHGENAKEWRKEPVSTLGLSLISIQSLNDAGIVLVGQLQDRVMASEDWWRSITGLTAGSSAAIVDRLNDFIWERTERKTNG